MSSPKWSVHHKTKNERVSERRIKKYITTKKQFTEQLLVLDLCFTLPEHLCVLGGGKGGVCLNENDAIPQPVFYKSAARRRENPAVILRVGYSSNNVITLCCSCDEWGKKNRV